MFSGIIESVQPILSVQKTGDVLRLKVARPSGFDDIQLGDSIATNGVCLTAEALTENDIQFALAPETLKVLGLKLQSNDLETSLLGQKLNLERSLKFGDRIHGHLVTGHVDSLIEVTAVKEQDQSRTLWFKLNKSLQPFVWHKGSLTLNGVSLTVNEVIDGQISVCLIPETLERTNLGSLKVGDTVTAEPDYMAKAALAAFQNMSINFQNSKTKEVPHA